MQLYREEAHYLERTAPWIERIGIDYIRQRLRDPGGRRLLQVRFVESQRHAQRDPWAERADGAEPHDFRALATVECHVLATHPLPVPAGARSAVSTTFRASARVSLPHPHATSPSSERKTTGSSRCMTGVRTKRGSCRRVSSTASPSPARCTTGSSILRTATRRSRTRAASGPFRSGWKAAASFSR